MSIKQFTIWLIAFAIVALSLSALVSFLICWNIKTLWLLLPLSIMFYFVCFVKVLAAYIRCKKGTK